MKTFFIALVLLWPTASLHAAGRPEPKVQVETFFTDLREKDGSAAAKELCEGTLLAEQKGVQLDSVGPQLTTALKLYGRVVRTENVEEKFFGESFVRHRLISYHETGAPDFWEFLFFRNKQEWQIYFFNFSDQFPRVFGGS